MMLASIHAAGRVPPPPPTAGHGDSDGQLPPAVLAQPVLVIEDESMIAWMIETILDDMGFTCVARAATCTEAASCAQERHPALVVSDINLGEGGNALDAVEAICRADPPAVLFVTAHADSETRARIAAAVPRFELLEKPVDVRMLEAAVRRLAIPNRPH